MTDRRVWKGGIPSRVSKLPRDGRGYPVPWFVAWMDGQPVFQAMDPVKLARAVKFDRCWICGEQMGATKVFTIGPMCCVNRLSSEPPSHFDCSTFAVQNCPFLASPLAKRRPFRTQDGNVIDYHEGAGIMLERNPGVTAQWFTKSFKIEKDPKGVLFRIGPAEKLAFWREGRPATRAEVDHSINTGLPALRHVAQRFDGPSGQLELERQINSFTTVLDGLEWAA